MKNLKNKTALITGASGGIGLALAHEMAKQGVHLVLVSRSEAKLQELAQKLSQEYSIQTRVIAADLSKPGEAARVFAETETQKIEIDLLINNAGTGLIGPAIERNPAEALEMLELNVKALTELSLLFAKKMAAKKSGAILNVASMVALMPVPFFAAYSASKSFVHTFSLALRRELKPFGVRVSCLLPGYVKTNFDQAAGVSNPEYEKMSASMGATPEFVAKKAIRLIQSGKAQKIPGFLNRLGAFFLHWIPKNWITAAIYANLKKKI